MNVDKVHQVKIKFLSSVLFLFFLFILFFLIRWQVLDSERYKALASQRVSEEKIPSIRGAILARDESTLAYSEPRFDIYVFKKEVEDAELRGKQTKEEFISKVVSVIGNEEDVRKRLSQDSQWIKVADKVSYEDKQKLFALHPDCCKSQELYGLRYELNSTRLYPENDLASNVVGFIGKNFNGDEVGRNGIEQYRDGILSPQEGFDLSEKDSLGNIIAISGTDPIDARRGSTIVTTIDKTLQQKVEDKLKLGVETYKAKSGVSIVMDPKTGEILAMAQYPDYDPNKYYEVKDGTLFRNDAISLPYEIGSVMKAVTMSSAVDLGAVTPSTVVVNGHQGCEHLLEEKEVCTYDKKPQGPLTALDALIKSDNIALYHTAQLIGKDNFYAYLKKFGVGTPTGIDLAGESYSSLSDSKNWNLADLATYSYGHSYQVTPIQAIAAIGSLANDGKLMQPYITSKIIDNNGEVKEFKPVVVNQTVSAETSSIMIDMLNEVYKSNIKESTYQRLYGDYKIAMKSGTALMPCALVPEDNCVGYSSEYNATYVGFDASPQRTFILIVKLERPELKSGQDLSFYNARHLWLDTFGAIKDYLGVPKVNAQSSGK
jgi:stage V sporulation protein D (sporulation-specific penicillin-binding protein)